MNQSEEIQELKEQVNSLIIQLALTTVKAEVLEDAFLDSLLFLKPDNYSTMYTNYINHLEGQQAKALNDVRDLLMDTGDPELLIRSLYSAFEAIQERKRNDHYVDYDGNHSKSSQ